MDGTEGDLQRVSYRAAARIIGVSERTVRRWAAAGRVTVQTDEDGLPYIRRDDALRLRSERPRVAAPRAPQDAPRVTVTDTTADTLESLRGRVAALEAERDAWREQAQTLARALPAARSPWWAWWRR